MRHASKVLARLLVVSTVLWLSIPVTLLGSPAQVSNSTGSISGTVTDPQGAAMYSLFTSGKAIPSKGSSITEGIGLGRATPMVSARTNLRTELSRGGESRSIGIIDPGRG